MKITVLDTVIMPPAEGCWEWLKGYGEVTLWPRTEAADTVARCEGCEVVFTNKTALGEAEFARLPQLRLVCVLATGYNIVDCAAATAHGVLVCNIPAYSTMSVAQTAFAHLLNIVNRVGHYAEPSRWALQPDFSYSDTPLIELAGKQILIVGCGRTGSATATLAEAFGMDVRRFHSSRLSRPETQQQAREEFAEALRTADVVSLHCPLTPATERLMDAAHLAMMKPTAILINTGRGPLVDEQALADALTAGRLFAAGLDVLCQEPPSTDNPLLTAPNCYLTPHIAWATREAKGRLLVIAEENLKAYLAGRPINVVNAVPR